ncbi:zinc finger protein 570-like [Periplaneta americana]|uniref:zinc finger protein 570-like n=1 Tax=Periplaneta americana TaxID=6978 RepID=UPI0037E966C5
MPVVCAAYNCNVKRKKTTDISYFRFPLKKKELLKQWIINMKRDKWCPSEHSFLCSRHFEDKYIMNHSKRRRILPTAVPTIFDFPAHLQKKQYNRPLPRERQNMLAISVRTTTPVPESEPIIMELNSSVAMDVIKTEPEVDPLAIQTSDNTDVGEKKPLSEELNLLNLSTTHIKTECNDYSSSVSSEMKYEEILVPNNFPVVKYEDQPEFYELNIIKEEQDLEVTPEENEVLTQSFADIHDSAVSSNCESIANEDHVTLYQNSENCICFEKFVPDDRDEKKFKCDVCGKCFSWSAHLKSHYRVHTGEKPFQCSECGKCFSQLGYMQVHIRVHTGEKPFKCNFCGSYFSVLRVLKQHERRHTGEKPYKCDVCGESFSQVSNKNRHERLHTSGKPFKCNVCGKCFSSNIYVKVHERLHSTDKPFQCDVCGECFVNSRYLKRHQRRHSVDKPFESNVSW